MYIIDPVTSTTEFCYHIVNVGIFLHIECILSFIRAGLFHIEGHACKQG